MSVNAPVFFSTQFATNISLLLQQQGSRLRKAVMEAPMRGSAANPINQIGPVQAQQVVNRFAPMGRVDAPFDRRWCFPNDFEINQLVDSFDELRMITDPKSYLVQNAVSGMGRQIDALIIAAANGTSQTGATGVTAVALPSGQQVAVNFGASGAVGLSVAKLRAARRILVGNDVDLETDEIWMAVNSIQMDNLLGEAQVISTDFNDKPVLVDGRITRFLGVNFIHTELVQTNGSGYRLCPMWVKSGMFLGIWGDIMTSTSIRHDLTSEPWQAYCRLTMGSTRTEEKKVVQVICSET